MEKWYIHLAILLQRPFSISGGIIKRGLSQQTLGLISKKKKSWIMEMISKHLSSHPRYKTANSEVLNNLITET